MVLIDCVCAEMANNHQITIRYYNIICNQLSAWWCQFSVVLDVWCRPVVLKLSLSVSLFVRLLLTKWMELSFLFSVPFPFYFHLWKRGWLFKYPTNSNTYPVDPIRRMHLSPQFTISNHKSSIDVSWPQEKLVKTGNYIYIFTIINTVTRKLWNDSTFFDNRFTVPIGLPD